MQIHNLKRKNKNKTSSQVGRGGKRGKTSGKGTKGQNARAGRKKRPEIRDVIKRLPKLRGRGVSSLKSIVPAFFAVNLQTLNNVFSSGDIVSPASLVSKGLVSKSLGKNVKIKILGKDGLDKKVIIRGCAVSSTAKEKIISLGGSVS